MASPLSSADALNAQCRCVTLCEKTLREKLTGVLDQRPNLFSQTTTFMSQDDFLKMREFIRTTEKLFQDHQIQEKILGHAVSQKSPCGVFMGYDFHLTQDGPRLIEINTNAGGAYLNLILAQSQIKCCEEENLFFGEDTLNGTEQKFLEMFRNEWARAGKADPLKHIAIVDEDPERQYLYPEFVLFKNLFEASGITVSVVDPSQLELKDQGLYAQEKKVDLIYNRLTDFSLKEERNSSLKEAWKNHWVVLTPEPDHHTLYANKKNLTFLTDENFLSHSELSDREKTLVQEIIPETRRVSDCAPDALWEERKNLFFKPFEGYGSKATYRGDKITRNVWQDILQGDYVAQKLIPPGKRVMKGQASLKSDIRAYTYQGEILLLAARLYEGQTTNFRTTGGGFSPVFVIKGADHGAN